MRPASPSARLPGIATQRWAVRLPTGLRRSAVAVVVLLGNLAPRPAAAADNATAPIYAALEAWQLEEALGLAQALLRREPDSPAAWLAAAHVQHHRGEHLSALGLIDAAQARGVEPQPGLRGLVEAGARLQANAESLRTEHFLFRYVNKDEILATYAAPVLEAAYRNLGADLGLLPAEGGEPIVVEIYPDARGLANATGLGIEQIETSGTIAVCKFHRLMVTSPLATVSGYGWADTISHELAHLIISKKSHNSVPIWLHEGIAKYFESRWHGEAGRGLRPYSERLLVQALKEKKLITFAQMHPSMALLPSQEAAALAFAEVFTTIEFLRHRYGNDVIPQLLTRLGGGLPLEKALPAVIGMGLPALEKAWRRYLQTRPFREVPGAAPRPIRLSDKEEQGTAERPLEKIADRESHNFARLGELLQLGGHPHAAVLEYEKAKQRSGLRYPTLIYRLARAYAEIEQPAQASRLLDDLLAVHPDEADAHLLAGRLALQRNVAAEARRHFEAVRLVNPYNPEIHLALAKLYLDAKEEKAASAAQRAALLASKPRPTRTLDLPAPPPGNALVSILTPTWSPIRINGGLPRATPAFGVPVQAGEITIEIIRAPPSVQTRTVAPGSETLLELD